MKSASLNKRERLFIFAVILLTFGSILHKLLISPELNHIDAAYFQLDSQQNLLKIRAEKIQYHSILNAKVQKLRMAITEAREVLFSKDEAADFLRLLTQMINNTGNVLITMKPCDMKDLSSNAATVQGSKQEKQTSEIQNERSYKQMPVEIAIRGKYGDIISFLGELEESKQLITVSEIDIATVAENPAEVDAKFRLNLYVCECQKI